MKTDNIVLYGITDSSFDSLPLEAQVEAAIKGGAGMIQLREKNITEDEYIKKAVSLLSVTKKYNVPLIINDNVKVAYASGADGVHLGQSDGDPAAARKILGGKAIIGVTAKTVEQAVRAQTAGADYLGSGAMFVSSTKPDAAAMSAETLRDICSSVSIPVYAIGGITAEKCYVLKNTGIAGIAAVSSVFDSDSAEGITDNAKKLLNAVMECIG